MLYVPDYQPGIIIVAGKQQRSFAYTYANWREVPKLPPELEGREPSYPSRRGSLYWYTNSGVYRKSDHWGYGIGTCDWLLDGQSYDGIISRIGYCRWDDFVDLERTSMRRDRAAMRRRIDDIDLAEIADRHMLRRANRRRAMWEDRKEGFSTTFWEDFTIADMFGIDAIKDTYKRAFREWRDNYLYLTDLVAVLNHKIWQHYEKGNDAYARLYNDLWMEAQDYGYDHLKGEELEYFWRVLD